MSDGPGPATAVLPSGEQYVLELGAQRAVVTEVGATLRAYAVGDREVLDGFPPDQMSSGGRGQLLLPWPNRVDGGRYTFDGATHQLPLNEPEKQNAIHGLTRWRSWRLVARAPARVALGLLLHPQPGYPFTLALEVVYTLSPEGLEVGTTARNLGARPLPFGAGQHPYFTVGLPRVDAALLHLPARTRLLVDSRSLPRGAAPVAGTEYDFNAARPVGPLALDTCFADLVPDDHGRVRVNLAHPGGAPRLTLTLDAAYQFVQVFTGDTLADPAARRRGLAIEPMTCAPDAFNNGKGLRILAPGERFTARWSLAVSG